MCVCVHVHVCISVCVFLYNYTYVSVSLSQVLTRRVVVAAAREKDHPERRDEIGIGTERRTAEETRTPLMTAGRVTETVSDTVLLSDLVHIPSSLLHFRREEKGYFTHNL